MADCVTLGYRYYGGLHHVLCQGPVDAVLELQADQRTAWIGPATNGIYHCNVPGLFGGDDGQGGIDGWFAVCLGEANQPANKYLSEALGQLLWEGVTLEIRQEAYTPGLGHDGVVEVYGALGPNARRQQISLGNDAWHELGGTWSRLTQLRHDTGILWGDVVIRRKDNQAEVARLPSGQWAVQLDWSYEGGIRIIPAEIPAFRGVVSCIFSRSLLCANNPFWPTMRWKVQRCAEASGWFPGTQTIDGGMNPAHILRELITSTRWGLGYPASALDDGAWRAAAQDLYDEKMGLNLIWSEGSVEEFAQTVLDHCDGRLYVHPRTGLWTLDLIRGGYDWWDLPILDAASVVEVERYERGAWDETVGEVVVTYMDSYRGKEDRVTVQNPANIAIQGAVVSLTRDYPGLGNQALARRVALRDLKVLSRPAAKATLVINRIGWDWVPGQVVRWQWPDYGIIDAAYRIAEIDYGTLTGGQIRVELVEDVFGLGRDRYALAEAQDAEEGVSALQTALAAVDLTPLPCPSQYCLEAPHWLLAQRLSPVELAAVPVAAGYGVLCGERPSPLHYDYGFVDAAELSQLIPDDGGPAAFGATSERAPFTPTALLGQDLTMSARGLLLLSWSDPEVVIAGGWAIIAADATGPEEIVRVDAIDLEAGYIEVTRGMMDTTPSDHGAGARIWFAAGRAGADPRERLASEEVAYTLLPRTGAGELAPAAATASVLTISGRAGRPYPPGRVRINGDAYPTDVSGDLIVAWSHRDRAQQTAALIGQDAFNIGPEPGTTYSIAIYTQLMPVLRRSH